MALGRYLDEPGVRFVSLRKIPTLMSPADPAISVVTPVYNGEKHLAECIESVLRQTYGNWEYIIVDNASTDDTVEICDTFAIRDHRIRVLRNENTLPMLANWNHALRQISGTSKFTKVIHADDLLFPTCLEQMLAVATEHPSVGLVAAYRIDGSRVNLDTVPYPVCVVSGRDMCRKRLLGGRDPFGSPSSTLIRSDLVRARPQFYNEDNLHGDTEACFDLLRETDYGFVHQVLTFTRRHEEAETTYARKMGTHPTGRLQIVAKYASYYLDEAEQKRALDLEKKWYYRFLARNMSRLVKREFRQFQIGQLQKAGLKLELTHLLGASAAVYGYDALFRAVRTLSSR